MTVSTLVFMDLETTGLPSNVGRKNVHITEISLVAVDRTDFESDPTNRVLNKLSLCVQPRTAISFGASTVTGLYNDMLENQARFDDSVPKLLETFLSRLRQPICLLAHNGRRFDFPVLQSELKRIEHSLNPTVLCADTLEALRSIGLGDTNKKIEIEDGIHQACAKNDVGDIDNGIHEACAKIDVGDIDTKNCNENHPPCVISNAGDHDMKNSCDENIPCAKTQAEINLAELDYLIRNEHKELCDMEVDRLLTIDSELFKDIEDPIECTTECKTSETTNFSDRFLLKKDVEHTPSTSPHESNVNGIRYKIKPKVVTYDAHTPQTETQFKSKIRAKCMPAKRKLFTNTTSETPKQELAITNVPKTRPNYSLEKLYYHFFGCKPDDGHHAEADCIALIKVCQKIGQPFLDWIDENNTLFCDMSPMW